MIDHPSQQMFKLLVNLVRFFQLSATAPGYDSMETWLAVTEKSVVVLALAPKLVRIPLMS